MRSQFRALGVAAALLFAGPALADFESGSTGSDGAFAPGGSQTVNLSLAGSGPGNGVYDPDKWAVIFNYTTISIPAEVTISFMNHPSGAPVVWLASGDVDISGVVVLDGAPGGGGSTFVPPGPGGYATPGPGGFSGGRGAIDAGVSPANAGFGPGGGQFLGPFTDGAGGYGTPGGGQGGGGTYGNEGVFPLIGGSGGAGEGWYQNRGGGAGGGAILIASSGTISLNGQIWSRGGGSGGVSGGGSGGAIRLVADSVQGLGILRAPGGGNQSGTAGGAGRIRIESPSAYLADPGDPPYSLSSVPGPLWPDATLPRLSITSVDGLPVPADPLAGIVTPDVVLADTTQSPLTIAISAAYIQPGTTVEVYLNRDIGARDTVISTPLAGTLESSTASATALFPRGRRVEIQLKANLPAAAVTSRREWSRR